MKKTSKDSPIPYTLAGAALRSTGEACQTAEGTSSAGRPDPYHAPAASPRLGRTPDTVPAKTSAQLQGGVVTHASNATPIGQRADSESGRPYAIDSVKAELRRTHWPECTHCERLEAEVLEAGKAVRIEMVKLCADYPAMYLEDVRVWEQSVAPAVAALKEARKRRDAHQKKAGHQP